MRIAAEPHADSDVDILVVMPARNELDQAVRISLTIDPPFPLDIGLINFTVVFRERVSTISPADGATGTALDTNRTTCLAGAYSSRSRS